jgi:crossover junction endodeoxyribonuclease RusA
VYGRVLLSNAARAWCIAAKNKLPSGKVEPLTGRLDVMIELLPPKRLQGKAWDIANREKVLCDLLTEQRIWLDDSQIDRILIIRGAPVNEGAAVVHIREL